MNDSPVLLMGFNRPEKMKNLISSLSQSAPSHLIFVIDGPRPDNSSDIERVRQVQDSVGLVNWKCNIETRFRPQNLGLRQSVTEGVAWAVHRYGKVIVIEDDVVVGNNFLGYMNQMISEYKDDLHIGHVNGYNVVPTNKLTIPTTNIRLSRYVESLAWGTWERAWKHYDDDLTWGTSCSIADLREIVGSLSGALRWKINFGDARGERINSWAYRWIASMWANNMYAISPNVNLVNYRGHDEGTHVLRRPRWTDLPTSEFPEKYEDCAEPVHDKFSDRWLGASVFAENPLGILDGLATSIALEARRRYRLLTK